MEGLLSNGNSDRLVLRRPLAELFAENQLHPIYSLSQVNEVEVPVERFLTSVQDVRNRLSVKLKNGFCSEVLINQLARHSMNIYEKFGDEIHGYHLPSILDIIEAIENGQNVNVRPFNRGILKGLQHAHHNASTFTVINIVNHWKAKCKKEGEVQMQNRLLNEIYSQIKNDFPPDIAPQKALTILLNQIHNEAVFRSQSKQTGEWIVFANVKGRNFFLCLATHNESKRYSDKVIKERIADCFIEFPELKIINQSI